MFDKIKQSAAAAVLATLLSATAIGATIATPADEAGPYVYVQAPVASVNG